MNLEEAKNLLRKNANALANEYTLDVSEAFKKRVICNLGGVLQGIVIGLNTAGALNELSSYEYAEVVKYVNELVGEKMELAGFAVYETDEEEVF